MYKHTRIIQPYPVGDKKNPSLAVVIPAGIVKEYKVTPDTALAVQTDKGTKTIHMRIVEMPLDRKEKSAQLKKNTITEASKNNLSAENPGGKEKDATTAGNDLPVLDQ